MKEIGTREYIILGALCFLLIFSGVQAVQVDQIEDSMQEFEDAPLKTEQGAASPAPSQPTMVGGC